MTDNLKACPFCGGEAEIIHDASNSEWLIPNGCHVACKSLDCSAEGPWDLGESGAIEAWNIRPIEDAQAAEIAELRAELAAMECLEAEGDMGAAQQQSLYDELEAKNKSQAAEIERLNAALDEIVNKRDTSVLAKKFCIHILECIAAGKPGVNLSDSELRRYDKGLAESALAKLREAANE